MSLAEWGCLGSGHPRQGCSSRVRYLRDLFNGHERINNTMARGAAPGILVSIKVSAPGSLEDARELDAGVLVWTFCWVLLYILGKFLVVIRCHPTVQALQQLSLVTKEVVRDRSINKNEQGLVFKLGEEEMRFNQHSSVGHDGVQHCQVVGGD